MNYWKGLNVDGWSEEVTGMRKMITQFAAIPKADITGINTIIRRCIRHLLL